MIKSFKNWSSIIIFLTDFFISICFIFSLINDLFAISKACFFSVFLNCSFIVLRYLISLKISNDVMISLFTLKRILFSIEFELLINKKKTKYK